MAADDALKSKLEAATGCLHNLGNVLTSASVSSSMIGRGLHSSKLPKLVAAVELLGGAPSDKEARSALAYIERVAQLLVSEHEALKRELGTLSAAINHARSIISAQRGRKDRKGSEELTDIGAVLEDALGFNRQAIASARVEVKRSFAKLPRQRLDRDLLLQVMINLVKNAVEATQSRAEAARIHVTARSHENMIELAVSDNGVGFDADGRARLFQHGFTTKTTGQGIGLSSSADQIDALGGDLRAHSDGVGCGATFTVRIPLSRAPGLRRAA